VNNNKIVFISLLTILISMGYPQNATAEKNKPAHPGQASQATSQSQTTLSGTLLETLNAGGYTYVKIDTDKQPTWAAGPVTTVKIGDKISFSTKMPMVNFHSKALNRDFEMLYFVGQFTVNGKGTHKSKLLDPHSKTQNTTMAPLKSFSKAENGQTIAEALASKSSQKDIKIRGQVSKFTAGVMGKNWIHIRDNSTNKDLTVTTDATVALNDVILISGNLSLNKDFGYGYVYDVIIEDASVTKESL